MAPETPQPDGDFNDRITLGDGAGDTVHVLGGDIGNKYDTIILGNGAGDTVLVENSKYNTITLGDGANDTVYPSASVRQR